MRCLEHHQSDPLSQDNLFSSLLGLLQIDTSVYAPRLDLFAGCRS